jgi:FlaA1/EpsC-like NDP-sugar epimerase
MNNESDTFSRSGLQSDTGSSLPFAATMSGSSSPFVKSTDMSRPPFSDMSSLTRVLLLVVIYSGAIVVAHWLAYLIRFEFHPPIDQQTLFWQALQWSLPIELLSLLLFGQFRSLLSYFSLPDARRIVLACTSASVVSLGVWYATKGQHAPPRSIIILSFLLDTAALGSVRLSFRMLRERQGGNGEAGKAPRRIVIVGAGDVGANLAKEMKLRRDLHMRPIAFFDDDQSKWNTHVHGVPVVGRPELLAEGKIQADEAVIAMPSASGRRVREVVQVFNEARIRFEIVPSMEQIVNGAVQVSQIRPVQLEDLLGRERIDLETERIRELVQDKVVMVTGAGGSIGGELCRQIAGYHPLRLLLVERCEVQMFQIEQELLDLGCGSQIVPLVADILDGEHMFGIFERFRPQLIFHAAAHKHVPMMEHQPFEAFRNNTIGTKNLAKLAVSFGVERFVLISTDKAINPTNVMGATKRLAELYLQALQRSQMGKGQGARGEGQSESVGPDLGLPAGASGEGWASVPREKGSEGVRKEPSYGATERRNGGATVSEGPLSETRGQSTGVGNPELSTQNSKPSFAASTRTKFMAVRFGNVLGSSGSVIPTFKKQIAAGGPVTVTHPEVTRYFMTIQEAVGLVLQSATQGQGGEIFVLDMGKLVKVADVARQLIELSGLKPEIDIEIKFIGLRPGEKLFEETRHNTENMVATDHPKIMRFTGEPLPLESLRHGLLNIHEKAASMDANQVKLEIQKLVPEYKPYLTTV